MGDGPEGGRAPTDVTRFGGLADPHLRKWRDYFRQEGWEYVGVMEGRTLVFRKPNKEGGNTKLLYVEVSPAGEINDQREWRGDTQNPPSGKPEFFVIRWVKRNKWALGLAIAAGTIGYLLFDGAAYGGFAGGALGYFIDKNSGQH